MRSVGTMATARLLVGAAGLAAGVVGTVYFVGLDGEDIRSALVWLVGSIVVHDFILAPVVLVLLALASPLPTRVRRHAVAGFVVLGALSVAVFPMLGEFGAYPDNPSLLNRPYLATWVALAVLVVLYVVVATWVGHRRAGPGPRNGAGPGSGDG